MVSRRRTMIVRPPVRILKHKNPVSGTVPTGYTHLRLSLRGALLREFPVEARQVRDRQEKLANRKQRPERGIESWRLTPEEAAPHCRWSVSALQHMEPDKANAHQTSVFRGESARYNQCSPQSPTDTQMNAGSLVYAITPPRGRRWALPEMLVTDQAEQIL